MKTQNNKKNKKTKILIHTGNFLMIVGFIIIFIIYGPFLWVYLFPQKLTDLSHKKGLYIQIPKISAQAPLIPHVNPWDKAEYLQKLKEGVALAQGTVTPGDAGTSYIFAHSSDYPWNITRYNTAFFRLADLQIGDSIYIFRNGERLAYTVYQEKIVSPHEVAYLKNTGVGHALILQTCTPIGTDWNRLLLFAKLNET